MTNHEEDHIDLSVDVRFAMIPYWILLHEDISPIALRVYGVIRKHADNETGEARPSRATLARLCRVSVKTIDRSLRELEKAGAVEVRARWRSVDGSSFSSAADGVHVVRAPSWYVVKSIPSKRRGRDTTVPTPVETSEGGGDMDVPTGGDTSDPGVGTPVTHELDPLDLYPEELDKEGGCVSGVRHHAREDRPVDNPPPLPASSVETATEPPADGDAPSPWCTEHPGGTTESCAGCGAARRARNRWEADTAKARAAEHRAEIVERNRAEVDEIQACGMCDAEGWIEPTVKCLHDPHAVETARRGAARVRAALAAKSRTTTEDPSTPKPGPAVADTAPETPIPVLARR